MVFQMLKVSCVQQLKIPNYIWGYLTEHRRGPQTVLT
jgi:hypothetical protein